MAEFQGERQTTEAHIPHAPKGHEQSDVALRPLIIIAIILVIVAVFTHVALWVAMGSFERDERAQDSPTSPVAEARPVPPQPRLQPTIEYHSTLPYEDVLAMQKANEQLLASYGWIDRERGIVHIPIERAMQQLLQQAQQREPAPRREPATAPQTQAVMR